MKPCPGFALALLVLLTGCELMGGGRSARTITPQVLQDEFECRHQAEEEAQKRVPPNFMADNTGTTRFLYEDCMAERGHENPPPF